MSEKDMIIETIAITEHSGAVHALGHRVGLSEGGAAELKRRCLEGLSRRNTPPDVIKFVLVSPGFPKTQPDLPKAEPPKAEPPKAEPAKPAKPELPKTDPATPNAKAADAKAAEPKPAEPKSAEPRPPPPARKRR